MDSGAQQHFSPTEIAQLAEQVRRRGPLLPNAEEAHPHLRTCPTCRDQFEQHLAWDRQLGQLRSLNLAAHQAGCPEPDVWRDVAGGVTASDQALLHLQHASGCDHCGPLLARAVQEVAGLTQPLSEAELKQISSLKSARPEWQHAVANRVTGIARAEQRSQSWWRVAFSFPRVVFASVAVVAIVAVGWWAAVRSPQSGDVNRLLARAYTEQRILEVRFEGAAYAPMRIQRGSEASFADRTPALLKAESLIATQLPSHPSDPAWLRAKARADLLEGKCDAAVESLRRALQLSPSSPGIMVDLASAYFQRAQTESRPEDYGAAYEYLSRVLAKNSEDPVALFNRALVSEHQFLFHQALDDWEHYLRVDSQSEWADEARKRADAVRAKLKEHDQSHAAPLLSPAQIVSRAADPNLRTELDQRVEEYLHEAVRSWLPQAYPDGSAGPDPGASQALFFLADLTAQQHGDRWLSDFLAKSPSADFSRAVAALVESVKASDTGDYERSAKQADNADRLFKTSANTPGRLYAEFERAFSAQLLRDSESCRRQADAALAESERYPYWWLQVQLGLEESVCSGIMGDLGGDEKAAQRAMKHAQRAGYGALFLRALGFVAYDRSGTGDQSTAWTLMSTGLSRYWSGLYPTARGYNLYGIVADMSETAGWPNLQLAILEEALTLMSSDSNLLLRARTQSEAARVATVARKPQIAGRHYSEAARLYTLVPQSEAVRTYRLYNQIRAAQAESNLGQFDDALGRLTRIQNEVRRLPETYLVQMFYSALGQVQLVQHRYPEAEQALRAALSFAEQNLASLHSEEQRIRWSIDAAPVYLGLAETELAQGRAQDSLETFEWYLGTSQRTGAAGSAPPIGLPDPSVLASRLPLLSRETVLAYGLLPEGLAIWSYDNRGVTAQWFPGQKDQILELVARFHDLASDPHSDLHAFRRDARSLYALMIAPLEKRLETSRTIVIETDESLARLPFEALLDPRGHYLLEQAPIIHSLGIYADGQLRPSVAISADSPVLAVASAAASQTDGLVPLPDVAAESEAVASSFRNARLLRGQEVTLSAIKAGLQTAAVFHFSGHSLSTFERNGLMLEDRDPQTGRSRLLDTEALRHLRAPDLQLAVLSACSSANATAGDPSGFSSLSEALLRAGVPHVVASRWAVDSSQTQAFVEDFYHNLLSGTAVSESMRLTARRMLSNPVTAHPYYWSAFAAYGRP